MLGGHIPTIPPAHPAEAGLAARPCGPAPRLPSNNGSPAPGCRSSCLRRRVRRPARPSWPPRSASWRRTSRSSSAWRAAAGRRSKTTALRPAAAVAGAGWVKARCASQRRLAPAAPRPAAAPLACLAARAASWGWGWARPARCCGVLPRRPRLRVRRSAAPRSRWA
jgi:hypothetical protein